jgi:hypothetical protein
MVGVMIHQIAPQFFSTGMNATLGDYGAKLRLPPLAGWGGAAGSIYLHSLWGSL